MSNARPLRHPGAGAAVSSVVCYGNVCRSPFAARALQRHLDSSEWQVLSAGTNAAEGKPASELMCAAAAEHGVDLSAHRASKVTHHLLRTSDLVITMSQRQAEKLLELEPTVQRRIRLLGGFSPQHNVWGLPADPRRPAAAADEIPDPSGEDFVFHQECCRHLNAAVGQLSRWVLRREASRPLPKPRPPLSAPSLRAARALRGLSSRALALARFAACPHARSRSRALRLVLAGPALACYAVR
jgi:protein-tyrosine phosphatase